MKGQVSVFLPCRKGSERIKNKNNRDFAGKTGGLLAIKLEQLAASRSIDEIIVSTNDPVSIQTAQKYAEKDPRIHVVERPEKLSLGTTSLSDLIDYVPGVCSHDQILWTHVTSPFVDAHDYDGFIATYFDQLSLGFDSLMTVKKLQNFIWDSAQAAIINKNGKEKWPKTQDLKVLYEINSAAFINSKENYLKFKDRIGPHPYLMELSVLSSYEIDWKKDFYDAEKLFGLLNG
ncbi:acylneuraminate cytidylyltransferase family protein [Pararhodonellum marinum]|uniref:acylneuraminate cytidylyltransferase family protein n=1 Tax=Pararhodonellum marinum TaxID=2755358 RepID=UPI001890139B|nr:acylneuraminate cytidylyltransferase family protein [Pararhodonellum marinum]